LAETHNLYEREIETVREREITILGIVFLEGGTCPIGIPMIEIGIKGAQAPARGFIAPSDRCIPTAYHSKGSLSI